MKKILPLRVAVYSVIIILSLVIIFHCLVLAGLVPMHIIWGGNLASTSELYVMEALSIGLNGVMLLVMLAYADLVRVNINRRWIIGAIWLMFVLFLLNTLGNLVAKSSLETYIFTPLTLLLSVFCFRIAAYADKQAAAHA